MAVVPTPKATHPTAPACGVWLSEPMMMWPGRAYASRILEWQIASEPCLPCPSSPYSLTPCFSANSRCFTSSWFATSSSPSCTRSGDMASLRKVRWSRKKRIDSGSSTFSSGPTSCSKKMADIGVTYSWLKRMSVCTNPASPGCTHSTPISPRARLLTQCRAKIFSAMVMGRRWRPCARPSGAVSLSDSTLEVEVATNCAAA